MKTTIAVLATLCSLSLGASPILGSGTWTPFGVNPNNNASPFWDNVSADGSNCNVGYFLAGGFGPCANRKNGTPAAGLQLGAANLEYYSAANALTPFTLDAGEYTFRLDGRIAGSNTFAIGYRMSGVDTTFFTQADTAGDTFTIQAIAPFSLFIKDGSNLFRTSDVIAPGAMAARNTADGRLFFGFEDRRGGDRDYNDVLISTSFAPVPEPGTYALTGLALAAAALARLRRK
jgi:hypothetical protein